MSHSHSKKISAILALFLTVGVAASFTSCGFTNTKGGGSATVPPNSTGGTGTGGGAGGGSTAATFSQVSAQILQTSCISCHSSGGQSPDLSSYSGFATNTQYVVPGNASASLIYTITESGTMPQSGSALTSDQEALLASWIDAGAEND